LRRNLPHNSRRKWETKPWRNELVARAGATILVRFPLARENLRSYRAHGSAVQTMRTARWSRQMTQWFKGPPQMSVVGRCPGPPCKECVMKVVVQRSAHSRLPRGQASNFPWHRAGISEVFGGGHCTLAGTTTLWATARPRTACGGPFSTPLDKAARETHLSGTWLPVLGFYRRFIEL
jgi:hypothetical protein